MQYNSVFALILRIALLCVLQVSHGGAALQVQLSTAVPDFDIPVRRPKSPLIPLAVERAVPVGFLRRLQQYLQGTLQWPQESLQPDFPADNTSQLLPANNAL